MTKSKKLGRIASYFVQCTKAKNLPADRIFSLPSCLVRQAGTRSRAWSGRSDIFERLTGYRG